MTQQTNNKQLKADYGMSDFYKYYCANSDKPVSAKKYNEIISILNQGIIDLILNNNLEYSIPYLGMTLCVRKFKSIPKIENGKLINNTPIDWKATNELWDENPEAKERKILLRHLNSHSSKNVFRIKILKFGKLYKNKKYYKFKAARDFSRALAKRILDPKKDNYDTFNLY